LETKFSGTSAYVLGPKMFHVSTSGYYTTESFVYLYNKCLLFDRFAKSEEAERVVRMGRTKTVKTKY
jgi:hypothetical protein